jgi:hypothetical protein
MDPRGLEYHSRCGREEERRKMISSPNPEQATDMTSPGTSRMKRGEVSTEGKMERERWQRGDRGGDERGGGGEYLSQRLEMLEHISPPPSEGEEEEERYEKRDSDGIISR